ncbi:MAG TPA: Ni/Fe hydrogenase subunit alpha [Verrucomicrobiota bacterium]|nr:Ni/Fe hydrogenase subunit alpha [Verrucomicrobiota bacterium]HNT15321.1 Ni/Fe hydrogenase subunit alpha [Verrucomicrobiota bacterium]
MATRILIDPVTRIEGHAKISLFVDDAGNVEDAEFHVVEFRGFEKFCEGRPYTEMPGITPRICGICPVSHLLASAKAGDAIMAVEIPPAADKLRRLMNLAQFVQSHALSFFHLSAPDFLLGWDTPQAQRNVFGLIGANKALARAGIRLRQFGQEIIEILGGRKIHPAWAVPGGVRSPLTPEGRERIRHWLPEAQATVQTAFTLWEQTLATHQRELETFGNFPSLFMGLVAEDGTWEHHGGKLRFTDSHGRVIADQIDAGNYPTVIGESVQTSSYLKSPYYLPLGFPAGIYRVGPLARLNVCSQMGVPRADAELVKFKRLGQGAVTSSFLYHYARLIEILAALEYIERYLEDDELLSSELRADAGINNRRGVGVSEAPRGTLFHDYTVDRNGLLQKVNLIVATGQNNLAMNRTVAQIARHYIQGRGKIPEQLLNRVEHGIRCYDPCLSCSTHAVGRMPLHVQLIGPDHTILDEVTRGDDAPLPAAAPGAAT